ncbi:hypothetical protein SLA_3816 [Streptomyces laurentii]|uniref:Uncharacterized protein n=1 Tax=Streptomyces laurentii TaxID=39478 RepID=A0A169NNG4_STRLU|nr:hypothetical protein SLA_3816 [Streptomyces laurentii]
MEAIPVLDWREPQHYDRVRDRPCCLCGRPTPMRSHDGEPAHKVCAEQWNHAHPDEPRLYTPSHPGHAQHDVGTVRFHNDGPTTPTLWRPAVAVLPKAQTDGGDHGISLFAA